MEENKDKKPEQMYHEMIVQALTNRKEMESKWDDVEKILDGDYSPLLNSKNPNDIRVKTHLMSARIETAVAVSMPPPDMEFIVEPANKTEGVDNHTAITAKALLDYYTNHHGDYEEFELVIQDFHSLNRGIVYLGFRPDTRDDTAHERALREGDWEAWNTFNSEGADRTMGQPYIERVPLKNFLIAPGFKTIDKAYSAGGWVAQRQIVQVDWVKNNKEFKKTKGISGCLSNPYIRGEQAPELKDTEPEAEDTPDRYEWYILWYIYMAPNNKHPKGKYVVFNPTRRLIHYEIEALDAVGFPYREVIDVMPHKGDYSLPKTVRAGEALVSHEYFETKALKGVRDAKFIVAYMDNAGVNENGFEKALKEGDDAIIPVKVNEMNFDKTIQVLPILPETGPAAEGSIRSKAIFDEIMGPNFADPRMGEQIATEMVFQNKLYMSKTNRNITKINRFINRVMTDKLKMTKDLVTPEEQGRMTREGSKNWEDHNEVTLDGNYVVTVKGSPLLDMTEGERSKLTQMVAQTIISLQAIPGGAKKYDASPLIKQWVEGLGYSTVGVIEDYPQADQWFELVMMQSGIPVEVEPEDNDLEHMSVIQEWINMLQQAQLEPDPQEIQLIMQHVQQHQQQLAQQKQGASMPGMNQENVQRQSMGETIRSKGALTPGGA